MSVNYATGNFFAGAFYDWLAERALSFSNVTTGTNTDSIMFGAQVGYRIPFSDSVRLTLAGTYFDFDGVQGYNPFFGGSSFGNTTTTSAAVCSRTLGGRHGLPAVRLQHRRGFADLTASVGGKPLRFFIDYAQNLEAEINPVASEKLDTAYATGVTYGAASRGKGTWEFGVLYQTDRKGRAVRTVAGLGLRRRQYRHEGLRDSRRLHRGPQLDAERHVVPQRAVE